MGLTEKQPFRILIQPARRWFSRRQQWTFAITGGNGEPIDPRDTLFNRGEQIDVMSRLIAGPDPVELVVYDRFGNVEERRRLR